MRLSLHKIKTHVVFLLNLQIEFVDELPKTVSGKIRRVELRNNEWGRETPDQEEES